MTAVKRREDLRVRTDATLKIILAARTEYKKSLQVTDPSSPAVRNGKVSPSKSIKREPVRLAKAFAADATAALRGTGEGAVADPARASKILEDGLEVYPDHPVLHGLAAGCRRRMATQKVGDDRMVLLREARFHAERCVTILSDPPYKSVASYDAQRDQAKKLFEAILADIERFG